MSSTHGFGIRAFGCNIRVETNCHETCSILERYVLPSLTRIESGAEKADILIQVVRDVDEMQLFAGGVPVSTADRTIDLVPALVKLLDDTVIKGLTTLRAVHAGAVLWGDRVILLPGVTHAGKSSLVAELLRRGATYFSDEYALIDSDGHVHPYPRPMLLRNGSSTQFPVLPEEYSAPIGDGPAPVGWILALEYLPGSVWDIAETAQSDAVLNLLRNTPHVLAESPQMVHNFQRAVAGAACYAGSRSEAVDATERILRLVGNPL
jgi:hypothetical protein